MVKKDFFRREYLGLSPFESGLVAQVEISKLRREAEGSGGFLEAVYSPGGWTFSAHIIFYSGLRGWMQERSMEIRHNQIQPDLSAYTFNVQSVRAEYLSQVKSYGFTSGLRVDSAKESDLYFEIGVNEESFREAHKRPVIWNTGDSYTSRFDPTTGESTQSRENPEVSKNERSLELLMDYHNWSRKLFARNLLYSANITVVLK